jgi:CcmD family protein
MTALYIVSVVIILIWSGIFGYLLHLDRQIKALQQEIKKLNPAGVKSNKV